MVYMKFMENQRNRSSTNRCSMLWKFVQTGTFWVFWCCGASMKVIITPLCCARLNSFHVVMLDACFFITKKRKLFFEFHKFSRVINLILLRIIYSFVSCLMQIWCSPCDHRNGTVNRNISRAKICKLARS